MTAAFCESPGVRVVLEAAVTFVRLANRELRHGPGDGLTLDARKLRSDQRAVQADFLSRRRRVPVVSVNRSVGVRPVVVQRAIRRSGFPGFWRSHENTRRLRVLASRTREPHRTPPERPSSFCADAAPCPLCRGARSRTSCSGLIERRRPPSRQSYGLRGGARAGSSHRECHQAVADAVA